MVCKPGRCQKGFTLIELLIVLAIIGIFWGVGISAMPRLLSGPGPGSLARRLAGKGQEARQMALLQQRPWELLVDLDQGVFYRAPLGAVLERELRGSDARDTDSLDAVLSSLDGRGGEISEQELISQRQDELEYQPLDTLRVTRRYDRLAFDYDDTDNDIFESTIPEEVRVIQIWKRGDHVETTGRVSLVFGPRGFIQPTTVWLEDADSPGKNMYTVYFYGVVPPVVVGGLSLPNDRGELMVVDMLP